MAENHHVGQSPSGKSSKSTEERAGRKKQLVHASSRIIRREVQRERFIRVMPSPIPTTKGQKRKFEKSIGNPSKKSATSSRVNLRLR